MAVLRVVALHEVVQVAALQDVFLQREVQVRAQVVDPELLRPRLFLRRLAVEEQNVRLHALRVEDARRQAQQRMHVGLLQQLAADGLPRAALEQHVVRQHHRRPPVLLQDREDVLQKVELLVARARPEIVAVDDQRFLRRLARLVHDRHAALLAERRIRQHDLVFPVLARQRVLRDHRQVFLGLPADAVQQQVHRAQARHAVHQLDAVERAGLEFLLLRPVQRGALGQVVVRRQQEPARAARRIADRLPRPRRHAFHHRGDQRARGEVLPRAALHVFGVLLQQALVGVALHVGRQARPLLLVDQVHDQPPQLGRVLDLVLRLPENQPQHPRLLAQRVQHVPVMRLQLVAVLRQQARPVVALGHARRLAAQLRLLLRHLQEQQERQLLDVIAVRQPVVPQDVAVVPELLDELLGSGHKYWISSSGSASDNTHASMPPGFKCPTTMRPQCIRTY